MRRRVLIRRGLLALIVGLVVFVLLGGWVGGDDDVADTPSSLLPNPHHEEDDITTNNITNNRIYPAVTSISSIPTLAVLCIGDSITFGNGTHSKAHSNERRGQGEGNYPLTLHTLLHQFTATSGRLVEVLNLGRSGRTAISDNSMSFTKTPQYTDARSFLRTWGTHRNYHHPKDRMVIVMLLGTNDSKDTKWRGRGAYKEALMALLRTFLGDAVTTPKTGHATTTTSNSNTTTTTTTTTTTAFDILFLTPPPALRRPTRTKKVWSYTSTLGKINTVRVATEVREAVYEVANLAHNALVVRRGDDGRGIGSSNLSQSLLTKLHQQYTFNVKVVDVYTEFTQQLVDLSFPATPSPPYHRGARVPTFPSVYHAPKHEAVLPWGIRSNGPSGNAYTHDISTAGEGGNDRQYVSVSPSSSVGSTFAAEKVIADRSLLPHQTSKVEEEVDMALRPISMPPSFPIEALWYSYPGGAEKLLHDGIHPRRIGHDLLAQLVAEAIH